MSGIEALQPLIGTWELDADFPAMPEFQGAGITGRAVFEWILNGAFLLERSEVSHPDAPDGYALIGVDGETGDYIQHYFDSRGIARVYAMTFDGKVWTLKRDEPDFMSLEFAQRFTGTFSDDGRTIRGRYEICHDGRTWEHDFDLIYRRLDDAGEDGS